MSSARGLGQIDMPVGHDSPHPGHHFLVAHHVFKPVFVGRAAFQHAQVHADAHALGAGFLMLVNADIAGDNELAHEDVPQAGGGVGDPGGRVP